jgi:hypothetical protein
MPVEAEQQISPKHYLATYTIIDGEHEHSDYLLIIAHSEEEARSFAQWLTHDCSWDGECDDGHPFSYGDGTTASKLRALREVSLEQFIFVEEAIGSLVYDLAGLRH